MKTVAVVFGGKSCEHEISVLTGTFVLNLLDRSKYRPVPLYFGLDGRAYSSAEMFDLDVFKKGKEFSRALLEDGVLYEFKPKKKKLSGGEKIDVAINCCHGGWGEGGGVSALFERNGIPLASPDVASSAVFLDKTLTKLIASALKIPSAEYLRFGEAEYRKRGAFFIKSAEEKLSYPVVVKPSRLGSSIGISVAKNEETLKIAIDAAFELGDVVLLERFLANKRDVNCAAYKKGEEIFVSEPEEAYGAGMYSFNDKYVKEKKSSPVEKVSKEEREKIRAYTRTLYKKMHFTGVIRADYLVCDGKIYLGEVNTVPGSLAYYLFCERLSDAKAFFTDLIEAAERKEDKKILKTNVLQTVSTGGKRAYFGVRV